MFKGDLKAAKKLIEELKIQYPGNLNRIKVFDTIVDYLKNNTPKAEDLKQFEGTYFSNSSEQTLEFWIENDRLVQYVSHQRMLTVLPAGPNSVGGGYVGEATYKYDLIKDEANSVVGISITTYYWKGNATNIFWKLDSSINEANQAFEKGDLETAEQLYEIALENNPKHSYINNIIAHLKFTKDNGPEYINTKNKMFAGNYGPRTFWIEDNAFYYKRKQEKIDLPKVKLLAMSDSTYMYMSKLGTYIQFEKNQNNQMASVPYSFVAENMTWKRLDDKTNYFLKE